MNCEKLIQEKKKTCKESVGRLYIFLKNVEGEKLQPERVSKTVSESFKIGFMA